MKNLLFFLSVFFSAQAFAQRTQIVRGAVSKHYVDSVVAAGGGGAGTRDTQKQTAAGSTTLTFINVPSDYNDYDVIVNGMTLTQIDHYTTVSNAITMPGLKPGDEVVFKRRK